MNRITIIGRVGQDPDIHTFDNGNKVASFSIATTERYKNRDGEKVEDTDWHNAKIFGKLVDVVEKYVHKGDLLALEGKVKYRKYEDKDGKDRYITEIICSSMEMLTPKSEKPKSGTETSQKSEQPKDTRMDNEPDPFGDAPFPGAE